jgi:uncharacterized protein YecE (DUF72 family)
MHDQATGELFPGVDLGSSERSLVRRAERYWERHELLRPLWTRGARILVGTSGYSFADWVGHFYPSGFTFRDMLAFYSREFATVEVNSTYYRIPPPRTFEHMARRTPPGFRFIVKLNQVLTHERRLDPDVCRAMRMSIEPLLAAGKLDGLLAQFPWSFRRREEHRRYLAALRRALPDVPLFVEFRHGSWARADTWRFLRDQKLGYAVVDEPALPGLMPPIVQLTAARGYVRLHGRNAQHWWGHSGIERYDYLYSRAELTDWLPRIEQLATQAERVYVFFNNCHAGKAAKNAQLMQELLATEV